MKKSIVIAFYMFMVGGCLQASPQPKRYQVEVIVFSHVTTQGLNSQYWRSASQLNIPSSTIVLQPANASSSDEQIEQPQPTKVTPTIDAMTEVPQLNTLLDPSQWMLANIAKRIAAKPDFHILTHISWLVDDKKPLNQRIKINNDSLLQGQEDTAADVSQLLGTLQLSRPYLFQMNFNLRLTLPDTMVTSEKQRPRVTRFKLQQQYRMKLGKLYYFDHPIFGVLAEINLFQPVAQNARSDNEQSA